MRRLLLSRLSDEQLTRRLAAGEAAAFDELYRRYVQRLAVYGRQLLGDGAGGEDVAQVALLNAYRALRNGVVAAQVRPWLYRIARNAALDMLSRRRELVVAVIPEREGTERPDDLGRGLLIEALRRLPRRQCHAWILREVNGLRMTEIADRLELRPEQVEQALFAARNSLAEELAFGERLDRESVRRLVGGPLAHSERRALRRHLRTCPDCRSSVTLGGGLGALVPLPLVGVVRQLAGALDGVTAPAAKVGAVVVAAAAAGSLPLASDMIGGHDPVAPAQAVPQPVQRVSPRPAGPHRLWLAETRLRLDAPKVPGPVRAGVRHTPRAHDAVRSPVPVALASPAASEPSVPEEPVAPEPTSVPDAVASPASTQASDPVEPSSDTAGQPAESSTSGDESGSPVSSGSTDSSDSSAVGDSSDVTDQTSEPDVPQTADVTTADGDSGSTTSVAPVESGDGSSPGDATSPDSSG
jgi:RNA polymerase sigma factor (sigma-70 family)